jgi:hypothetical protein
MAGKPVNEKRLTAVYRKNATMTSNDTNETIGRRLAKASHGSSYELLEFEDFARRAVALGFTVHLTHYRFHPVHTAKYQECRSCVRLSIIPMLDEAQSRFGGSRDVNGDTIAAVLVEGRLLIDRYESGENVREKETRSRKKPNITDEERERRRQRMLHYWSKRRGQVAATSDQSASAGAPEKPGIPQHA